jgi:phosphoglycolate phosphatase-like HAD superfamily hydrolase
MARLSVAPSAAMMIGDSESDLAAAWSAGVPVIGFANLPTKHQRLAAADAVIDDMAVLAGELNDLPNACDP